LSLVGLVLSKVLPGRVAGESHNLVVQGLSSCLVVDVVRGLGSGGEQILALSFHRLLLVQEVLLDVEFRLVRQFGGVPYSQGFGRLWSFPKPILDTLRPGVEFFGCKILITCQLAIFRPIERPSQVSCILAALLFLVDRRVGLMVEGQSMRGLAETVGSFLAPLSVGLHQS
jgi:hypothetical protein